ncbi:hypothetical protein F5X96DRAFT_692425 [Biscogniauxia mediterranea]|nr:hypothetical protein F5X96DRAFT_692425 [Biscogniauxia mediterranea]
MASPSRFPLSMLDPQLLDLPALPDVGSASSTMAAGPGADDNTQVDEEPIHDASKRHPNYRITQRNNESWLFKFPGEILEKIIQFAIGDPQCIQPRQASNHGNMFFDIITADNITLLAQCNLETLTVQFKIRRESWWDEAMEVLLAPSFDLPGDAKKNCIWSLPGARIALKIDTIGVLPLYHEPWTAEEKLAAEPALQDLENLRENYRLNVLEKIRDFRDRYAQYQHYIKQKDRSGEGLRSTITKEKLWQALLHSDVDFPGELRIKQIADPNARYGYLGGGPSRRTRSRTQRVTAQNITLSNSVARPRPPCTNDPFRVDVRGLRWSVDTDTEERLIEVAIIDNKITCNHHPNNDGSNSSITWQSIDSINHWWTYLSLLDYLNVLYDSTYIRQRTLDEARVSLEIREDLPGPLDIMDAILPTLMYDMETGHYVPRGIYQKKFRALHARRENYMRILRNYIARLEAELAREIRKAAREAEEEAEEAAAAADPGHHKAPGRNKRKHASAAAAAVSASAAEDADNTNINVNTNDSHPEPKKRRRSPRNQ